MSAKSTPMTDINADIVCQTSFEHFEPLRCDAVLDIIKKLRVKTCPLDPLPAGMIKEYLPEALPSITLIVNTSLQMGVFPASLKEALVTPLLKKANLDVEDLKELSSCIKPPLPGESYRACRHESTPSVHQKSWPLQQKSVCLSAVPQCWDCTTPSDQWFVMCCG